MSVGYYLYLSAVLFTIGAVGAALHDGIVRLGRYLDDDVLRRMV